MRPRRRMRYIKALPIAVAILIGGFLAVASWALSWSAASTFVVGIALVAMLGLFGTPLLLLDFEALGQHISSRRGTEADIYYATRHPMAAGSSLPVTKFVDSTERQQRDPSEFMDWRAYQRFRVTEQGSNERLAFLWDELMSSNQPSGYELVASYPPRQVISEVDPKLGESLLRAKQIAMRSSLN